MPWAASADGNVQIIDLRPGPNQGRLGWAGHAGSGDFEDGWPNLPTLLHAIARALDHGGSVQDLHPYLAADGKLWWGQTGQHELNGSILHPVPAGIA